MVFGAADLDRVARRLVWQVREGKRSGLPSASASAVKVLVSRSARTDAM